MPQGQPVTTNDVALLYVSRWQTPEAAQRFAKFYAGAVAKRYRQAEITADWKESEKPGEALASIQLTTEEGPVVVELWPGNMVFVSESFDQAVAARLRAAVIAPAADNRSAENFGDGRESDLTLRLASSPELAPVRDAVQDSAMRALRRLAREAAGR